MVARAVSIVGMLALWLVWIDGLAAHDLPTDVLIQAFVKPEGQRVRLVLRVPLVAMGDIDYPTRGPGGPVDLARVDRALQDAVALWIAPGVVMYENDRPLAQPRVVAAR